MAIAEVRKTAEHKMQRSVEALKTDLAKVRTGRAHTGLLDHVHVEYFAKLEKAVRDCDLGLNPSAQGDLIRVPMPPLTEARRRELIKVVKGEGEAAKVAVRNLRRDAIATLKEMLKHKECSEDEEHRAQDEIQKLTDRYVAEIDKLLSHKETELMAI